jgi:exodeoxyribonuclease V beta subunit
VLADSLLAVYDSPLGTLAADLTLRDFTAVDRLTELNFELPLAGGDAPGSELRLGALGPVLARHLGGRDPLKSYSERLSSPLLRDQPLRGFLNGSLDAVLRVREGADVRYVVVDYKTNWLSAAIAGSGQLTASDYTPARMADSMLSSDYPLQALLYSVALHRYLRWRQPGYAPEQHLGGALYLYLRGMCGPKTPLVDGQPCGVFAWRPPEALVLELSDLLDSGRVG